MNPLYFVLIVEARFSYKIKERSSPWRRRERRWRYRRRGKRKKSARGKVIKSQREPRG